MPRARTAGALIFSIGLLLPEYVLGGVPLPSGQDPDMIAWEEFAQINAPSGNPNFKRVEFETWAADDDIYVKSPAQWPTIDAPKVLQNSVLAMSHSNFAIRPFAFIPGTCLPPQGLAPPKGDGAAAGSGFPVTSCIGEEVRRNWASFQYIVANGLDSKAGLIRAFAGGLKVDMPADSVEFKGDWAAVADVATWLSVGQDVIRQHYYTSTSKINNVDTEIALLGFHISTKQIKDWVWIDFEGEMNPGRCDTIGCHDSFGAVVSDVGPNEVAYKPYGECQKKSNLVAMLNSSGIDPIWRHYCLKGTQVTFIDENGQPVLLGNSIIEPLNAGVPIEKSSCITCHGYASFDKNGQINIFPLAAPLNSPIGNIDPSKTQGFVNNDFLWGISLPNLK